MAESNDWLDGLSLETLHQMQDEAGDKGYSKGYPLGTISAAINRRTAPVAPVMEEPVRQKQNSIDGSAGMMGPNKYGAIHSRSKR